MIVLCVQIAVAVEHSYKMIYTLALSSVCVSSIGVFLALHMESKLSFAFDSSVLSLYEFSSLLT